MRWRIILTALTVVCGVNAQAQQGVPQVSVDSGYSSSQLTVVPIMHSPLRDTVYAVDDVADSGTPHTSRQKRAWRAEQYKNYVDSLVQSRDFVFRPESMRNAAGGVLRMIYAEYFYLALFVDTAELHLPLQRVDNYVTVANVDSPLGSFDMHFDSGGGVWNVAFNVTNKGVLWGVQFNISDITGHVTLTLATPQMTMLYFGTIAPRRDGYILRNKHFSDGI